MSGEQPAAEGFEHAYWGAHPRGQGPKGKWGASPRSKSTEQMILGTMGWEGEMGENLIPMYTVEAASRCTGGGPGEGTVFDSGAPLQCHAQLLPVPHVLQENF